MGDKKKQEDKYVIYGLVCLDRYGSDLPLIYLAFCTLVLSLEVNAL
jgi:hypothetical protein